MSGQRLVNRCLLDDNKSVKYRGGQEGTYLEHLCAQRVLVKVDLGQTFESVFTTVSHRGGIGDIIEVDRADGRESFGRWRIARQDLTDLVDNGITSGTESPDNLKLDRGGIEIVVAVAMTGGNREKPDPFTLEI